MALIRVGWARLGAWCVHDDTDTEQAEDGADEVARSTKVEAESVQYGPDGAFIHTPDIHDAVFPLAEVAHGRVPLATGEGEGNPGRRLEGHRRVQRVGDDREGADSEASRHL